MNKRLLFLGAIGGMFNAAEIAKEKGYYTVAVDYYAQSQAKEVADRSYKVSTLAIDDVVSIAQKENIQGVFTGFSDYNLRAAREVCTRLKLPFYVTSEQIEKTQNKIEFATLCRIVGLQVPHEYHLTENGIINSFVNVSYPLIVKPSDNQASVGITVCNSAEELLQGFNLAKKHSRNGQVIITDYIYGQEFFYNYMILNGKFYTLSISDRDVAIPFHIQKSSTPPLSIISPSSYENCILSATEGKLRKLLQSIGIYNGIGFFQGIVNETGVYFFEMALRFGGHSFEVFNRYFSLVDPISLFLEYANTGVFPSATFSKKLYEYPSLCCNYALYGHSGRIADIIGLDKITKLPAVITVQQYAYEGDTIQSEWVHTYKAMLFRVLLVASSKKELEELKEIILDLLQVKDFEGEDMVVRYKNYKSE